MDQLNFIKDKLSQSTYFIHIIGQYIKFKFFSIMKTRRQLRQEAVKQVTQKQKTKKPTKAEVMKQKQEKQKEKRGQSIGAKRKKQQISIEVIKQVKNDTKKVTVKAIKKQKQERVKVSPQGRTTRQKSIAQTKIEKSIQVKSNQSPKKKQKGKSSAKEATKQTINQSKDQDLTRKKPEAEDKKQPQKEKVKTLIMKGKTPIDEFFPLKKQDYHVLQMNGKVYSATLNQTNVQHNNNKFYMLQILQSDTNSNSCYFFTRWGRVGVPGQNSLNGPMTPLFAISSYESKYREKSKKGDYVEVHMNYTEDDDDKAKQDEKKTDKKDDQQAEQKQKIKSTLPKSVQSLIELIFDLNMMKQQMVQIGYNVNKMPLGKLSKQSIKKGYNLLKQLSDQIKNHNRKKQIVRLTNEFFSNIPHDFGFSNMANHILDTEIKVKSKLEMLESLAQIKVATSLINQGKKNDEVNKIDANYAKLNRNIAPVDKNSTEFKTIDDYLQTTHGKHHTSYSLQLVDLFSVQSDMEGIRYTKDIHNKKLLWHGSRLTNFVGILSQGLRIAPPQAPVTGYMFGKGVYFADMSSKSANYCFTSKDNNTGILLLCQVALGNMNEKTHADYYAANLPDNKHSTKGVGKIQPDPKNAVQLEKGVQIPMGPGIQSNDPTLYLRYNEFIVYDIAQIKIRYILRLKFNYVNNFGSWY